MLLRMYTRWAERKGFKIETIDLLTADDAGIKSADLRIVGEFAYGYLKAEKGIHRLVRISPFNANGKRQTSFASIEVLPELTASQDIEIRSDDLRIDSYRSGGAGGQHVNKTESAIRITHIPTGIVVQCQNERSQHHNKDEAMKMLKSKLVELKERAHKEKIEDLTGELKDIGWGSQIRSYVFQPYTLVKDHRTGVENGNINAVMNGEIDEFINEYLKQNTN
jgi:peptide chain release factor 2